MSSLIRKSVQAMTPYVPGEQPRDRDVVKLNTNENPYPPSPRVREVLEDFDTSDLAVYPDPTCSALRHRIAEIHHVGEEQVIVGNGTDELLALCTRAFVEPGGVVGAFDLTYSLYPVLSEIQDLEYRSVPLGKHFEWAMPLDANYDLFFLANPNAPTGTSFAIDDVRRLCAHVAGVVLIDEAYVEFANGDCMGLVQESDNVIVTRTLSKAFSLAGLRLGYAIGPEELIKALLTIKDSYNVSRLTQELGLAALSDLEHMRENCEAICRTRKRVRTGLVKMGFEALDSKANFLWVKPPRVSAEELFEELRKVAIVVRYFPGEMTGEYLRISIGTDEEMDRFLDETRDILIGEASNE